MMIYKIIIGSGILMVDPIVKKHEMNAYFFTMEIILVLVS